MQQLYKKMASKVDPRNSTSSTCSTRSMMGLSQIACLSAFLLSFLRFLKARFLVAVCIFAQMSSVVIRPWSFVIDVVTLNAAQSDTNWENLIGLGVILAAIIIIDSSDSVGEERVRGDFWVTRFTQERERDKCSGTTSATMVSQRQYLSHRGIPLAHLPTQRQFPGGSGSATSPPPTNPNPVRPHAKGLGQFPSWWSREFAHALPSGWLAMVVSVHTT